MTNTKSRRKKNALCHSDCLPIILLIQCFLEMGPCYLYLQTQVLIADPGRVPMKAMNLESLVNPANPGNPVNPENPVSPANPVSPENPGNPGNLVNPVSPENPENLESPGNPGNLVNPGNLASLVNLANLERENFQKEARSPLKRKKKVNRNKLNQSVNS